MHKRSRLDELLDRRMNEMRTVDKPVQPSTVGRKLDNELNALKKDIRKKAGLAYVMGHITW